MALFDVVMPELEFLGSVIFWNLKVYDLGVFDAERVFQGPFHIMPDKKQVYSEDRLAALGFIEDFLVRLSYTMRGEIVRVISLRLATPAERRLYEAESSF